MRLISWINPHGSETNTAYIFAFLKFLKGKGLFYSVKQQDSGVNETALLFRNILLTCFVP
jgi:hypothetical protein